MQRIRLALARLLATCLITGQLTGCAVNPVQGNRELVLMSEAQEISLGRKNHQLVVETYGWYEHQALQDYIQQIGDKLAATSHRPGLYYRFTLLDSPEVNAFALPGGYIYITRGMLAYLNSEAQLAAILGHEIGHVTARHGVRQQTASTLAELGVVLGQVLLPELRTQGAQQLTNVLGTAILRGYGREHELQADSLAAEYLANTGYNPEAILEVLTILKNQADFDQVIAEQEGREATAYHGLFATHPDNDTRLQQVIGKVHFLAPEKQKSDSREPFLRALDGLIYGDSAKQGIRRGNHFYHASMGFAVRFPAGWNLKNQPDRVLAIGPGGTSWIELRAQDLNKKLSPREFLRDRLGITQIADGQAISPDGLPGYTGIVPVRTSRGTLPARVAVIFLDRTAYIMTGVQEQQQPGNGDPILETIHDFHRLRDDEKSLAQPLILRIRPAKTSFQEMAKRSRIPGHAESVLRLLNQYYPNGEPPRGTLIKIVE